MKQQLILIITSLLIACQLGQAQIKELQPSSVHPLNLSEQSAKLYDGTFQKIWDGVKYDDLSAAEKKAIEHGDETKGYWETVGSACSWYCGGSVKNITASSFLKSQGTSTYTPKNAHDFSYKNAWVEGVDGYGIGEYLLYSFPGPSPRINQIIVVNGYVKSPSAYKNNSRVKKLKVYMDDEPYAILNLKDIRSAQHFDIGPLPTKERQDWEVMKDKPDWTLKFEILDVYKGDKYDDTVISEIYFDGLDVHCFAAGTKVLMADKTEKNIEDVKPGDLIYTPGSPSEAKNTDTVEKVEAVVHNNLVTYVFESGATITATQDHPFMVNGKGWCSLQPNKTRLYESFNEVNKIMVGDDFTTIELTDKLVEIVYLEGQQMTYTISKTRLGNIFCANGFLVGVEEI